MAALFDLDPNSGFCNLFVPFGCDFGGVGGVLGGGLAPPVAALDGEEKGGLAEARAGKRGVSEEKALVALKNHCEAERRRRERINARLAILRGLVPSIAKMDKASLLAAVITQVKELKNIATEASKGFLIPMNSNEVKIEPLNSISNDGTLYFRASLCCDYRPELMTDIKEALDALKLKLIKAEVSTLGGRVKNEFILSINEQMLNGDVGSDALQLLVASIRRSLTSVLDVSSPLEYSPRSTRPYKRRRISSDSSSSSSL